MAIKSGSISNIKGATVFIDKNGDGIWNEGEVKGIADASGVFSLSGKGAAFKGTLISTGGINMTTGLANTETFMAPKVTKVVNSLTTLVAQVAKDEGLSMGQAMSQVKDALGIKLNILSKDPAALAESGKAGSTAVTNALAALEVQKQIDTVLKLGASTLSGAAAGTDATTLKTGLLSALVQKVVSGAPLDLTSGTLVSSVLTSAATAAGLSAAEVTKVTTLAADAASVITASTAKIAESIAAVTELGKGATTAALDAALTKVVNVETVAATVSGALQSGAAGGSLTSVKESYTGTALDGLVVTPPAPPTTGPVTPPVTPPSGGGGGGSPSPTFTMTVSNDGSNTITFAGTATGDITLSDTSTLITQGGHGPKTGALVFVREGITASADFTNLTTMDIQLATGQVLKATAELADGLPVSGAGSVVITANGTDWDTNLDYQFDEIVVAADLQITAGNVLANAGADFGNVEITVASGATLTGSAAQLTGKTITGTGSVTVTGLASNTDLTHITPTTLNATVTSSMSLAAVDLSNVDHLTVGSNGGSLVNVTVSADQLTALTGKTTIGSDDALTASAMTVTNNYGTLTLGGTAAGNVTIDLNAATQTISEGSMPSGGPFSEVNASTLTGGGIVVTGKDDIANRITGTLQADTITGGNQNDYITWIGGADQLSGGVAGPGSSVLYFNPSTTPTNATGLVINASASEKTLGSGKVAGGTATTIAAGKAAWVGATGTDIAVTDQVTFSAFDSYSFDNVATQFFGSDTDSDVIYVYSKISASTVDGGTEGGTLAMTGQIANFTNAAGFVVNLSNSQQTLQGSMQIAGGTGTTINAGKVGLIGATGNSITNTDQLTISNLGSVWFSNGDNQIWGNADGNLFQQFGDKGENYINGGDGSDTLYLNLTTLATNATGIAVNLGSGVVTLENGAKVAASFETATLAAGKLALIGATGTDITNTKQDTLVSIEAIYGGSGNDQFFGSDNADTFGGDTGADVFVGGGDADTLRMNGWSSQDTNVDTVIYAKSTDGGATGDSISGITAGATNGDILKFIDAGNTTDGALDLTGTDTKTFNSGAFSSLTATEADNVWVITDTQATWTTAAAVDAAIDGKAHASMTGGLVLVFKTGDSLDAQVWYLGSAKSGTEGADVVKLATLVGITDLTTLMTDNFAVI